MFHQGASIQLDLLPLYKDLVVSSQNEEVLKERLLVQEARERSQVQPVPNVEPEIQVMEDALFKFYTTELASMALNFLTGATDIQEDEKEAGRRKGNGVNYRGLFKYSHHTYDRTSDKTSQPKTSSIYDFHNLLYHEDEGNNNPNFHYFNHYNVKTTFATQSYSLASSISLQSPKTQEHPEETNKKVQLLKMTADAGSNHAKAALGKLLLRSGQNSQEGLRYLTMAADEGNAYAKFDLANFYFFGVVEWDIPKDLKKAAHLFSECTGLFHEAQEILGRMYYLGEGVEQNTEEAARLFRLAKERGNVTAQAMLQLMKVRKEIE